jgi:uncharacterized integral membrane protein
MNLSSEVRMGKAKTYFIVALLFALSVSILAIQNPDSVNIKFLFWQWSGISKVLIILASAAVGAVTVIFLGSWWQFKKAMYIRQLEAEIKVLKNQQPAGAAAETMSQETNKLPHL